MQILFAKHFLRWIIFGFVVALAIWISVKDYNEKNPPVVEMAEVTVGTVQETITVSGKIEAKDIAELGFPRVGIIQNVYKKEGDAVTAGEILASLTQDSRVADYNRAVQNLKFQESLRDEVVRGPRDVAREVTATQVSIAEENARRIKEEQAVLVKNALETLLSTDLEAVPARKTNDNVPPTISGNYLCAEEGAYTLATYGSKSPTGYSYNLSGLEEGTFTAYIDTPAPLGTCGLMIKFDSSERYQNEDWIVDIPNKKSPLYLTNYNAYQLALQQQKNAVEAAEQAITLAYNTEKNQNSPVSRESLSQAEARIAEARATVAQKEAEIADYSIKAPFDGILTNFDIKVGELSNTGKNITIIKEGAYTLKARIPEIDIRKINLGSAAIVQFDAAPATELEAKVTFISPLSSEIGGVAYYDTDIELKTEPDWIREGLNADVKIESRNKKDVPVLQKRFIIYEPVGTFVLQPGETGAIKTEVHTGLTGTNGFVEVLNLPLGTTVVLP